MEPRRASTASALLLRPVHPTTFAASPAVRQAAAHHLEERHTDWVYSRPVLVLDVALNMTFAAAASVVLCATTCERPDVPLRVWISGYALQCMAHVGLIWREYRRRRRSGGEQGLEEGGSGGERVVWDSDSVDSEEDSARVSAGNRGHSRLTVVFLTFDALFAIFCIAFTCIIGIALCCCLPCVIAILCSVIGQEGASDADISMLSRYRYSELDGDGEKFLKEGLMVPDLNNRGITSNERVLPKEDAGCCICLTSYEDGNSILSLPCNHHFHSSCIVKWLWINATCPLCKCHILND
ncbi:E3 ubiquitin protein ligase RIE1-like isoform X2 [Curcuma longa]|uniref:E3 ubiquitin protein ligase RIE1-like isoform X2 n=1 Tax=Curcuma longa TaxID=136217 RepID=UPI003D9DE15A